MADAPQTVPSGAWRRNIQRVVMIALLVWAMHLMLGWAKELAEMDRGGLRLGMLVGFLLVYSVLIAVPFVPGIEVGLTLMAMEGPWIAPWIYLATVTGLGAAFAVGEWLPYARLRQILADLKLRRACGFIEGIQSLDRRERLSILQDRAPRWLRPLVSRYRYVLLALLINLPGNAVLGGGGGLLFMAGFSRLFHPVSTAATIALAVAPVPVAFWMFGFDVHVLFG